MNKQQKSKFIQQIKNTVKQIISTVGTTTPVLPVLFVHDGRRVRTIMLSPPNSDEKVLQRVEALRRQCEAVASIGCGYITVCEDDDVEPESQADMIDMEQTYNAVIMYAFFSDKIFSTHCEILEDGEISEWREEVWVETSETTFDIGHLTTLE